MKKIVSTLIALTLLLSSQTIALARGYGGGSSYHSSYGGYGSSYSHSYSSSGSPLPSSSGLGGSYHSGRSLYSGGSTYRSGSTYHSGYSSSSRRTSPAFGGSFRNGFRGFGLGHIGSFFGGFLLGNLFHPFGWGLGGGYGGPGYFGGLGSPGYSPVWSVIGTVIDLIIVAILLLVIFRVLRALSRRRRAFSQPLYEEPYGSARFGEWLGSHSPAFLNMDEQAVVDACCEYVAVRDRCAPQEVEVDLAFHRNTARFGASILIHGRLARPLEQQDLVDAISEFISSRERVATDTVDVDLQFDEGFGVHASVRIA